MNPAHANQSDAYTMSDLRRRLEAGEPAQAILDGLVEYIKANDPPDPDIAAEHIAYMADQGARVATGLADCVLGKLVCDMPRPRPALYLGTAYQLIGKPGELPLHVMARHGHLNLGKKMLAHPQIKAGLRTRDPQGRSIAHWLWDEHSDLVKKSHASHAEHSQPTSASDRWEKSISVAWYAWATQSELLDLGVGMDDPDDNGITALDLCAQRLADGTAVPVTGNAASDFVQAALSSRDMNARTPQPTTADDSPSPSRI